ncbi:MAG: hypothetical protein ABI351_02025 [Herbaspirillum sp.]
MMNGCLSTFGGVGSMMGWGMGGFMLVSWLVLLLAGAALIKYLFFRPSPRVKDAV